MSIFCSIMSYNDNYTTYSSDSLLLPISKYLRVGSIITGASVVLLTMMCVLCIVCPSCLCHKFFFKGKIYDTNELVDLIMSRYSLYKEDWLTNFVKLAIYKGSCILWCTAKEILQTRCFHIRISIYIIPCKIQIYSLMTYSITSFCILLISFNKWELKKVNVAKSSFSFYIYNIV